MSFALRDLDVPVLGAPMAGGPGTPQLAAAVSSAGGLGFLPGGYLSAQQLAENISATRSATTGPLGVNLFVPQASIADPAELDRYRATLQEVADRYGVEPGAARWDDDGWADKVDLLLDVRPEVVSFTFALPDPAATARLRAAGIAVAMTVTSVEEVRAAAGFDVLVVQGPEAGCHRGTCDPAAVPGHTCRGIGGAGRHRPAARR